MSACASGMLGLDVGLLLIDEDIIKDGTFAFWAGHGAHTRMGLVPRYGGLRTLYGCPSDGADHWQAPSAAEAELGRLSRPCDGQHLRGLISSPGTASTEPYRPLALTRLASAAISSVLI